MNSDLFDAVAAEDRRMTDEAGERKMNELDDGKATSGRERCSLGNLERDRETAAEQYNLCS